MNNVVIDTSVWLSLIFNNQLPMLHNAVHAERIAVYSSTKLRAEILSVLQYKKFKGRFLPMLAQYGLAHDVIVRLVEPMYVFNASPDPNDNYLFDICRESDADYLVTGDRALFGMEQVPFSEVHTTEIISLTRFRKILSSGVHSE
jgi:hypothetical protein